MKTIQRTLISFDRKILLPVLYVMFVSDLECESEQRLTKHPHCSMKSPRVKTKAIEL